MSLLFFPLLIGVGVAYSQWILAGLYLKTVNQSSSNLELRIAPEKRGSFIREFLMRGEFDHTQICRWPANSPPSESCRPRPLDIAIQVRDPLHTPTEYYEKLFDGLTGRVHICTDCRAEITVDLRGETPRTDVFDLWSLPILSSASLENVEVNQSLVRMVQQREMLDRKLGDIVMHLPGFREPISGNDFRTTFALIFASASTLVIALWLALRGHRNVLDYFAHNGALLPLVAACGKGQFYGAIWWITVMRIASFLLAVIPASSGVFIDLISERGKHAFLGGDPIAFLLWLVAITCGLSVVVIVASIGELRHRASSFTFLYKYVPIVVWIAGSFVWCLSLVLPTPLMLIARGIVTALPVVGLTPVIMAPALKPSLDLLVLHSLLAVALLVVTLRHNSRWFAAHLEEV